MKNTYKNDRVVDLKHITARHSAREIEGCTSWRHFAVHQDRAWLLSAIRKIHNQVEQVRQASESSEEQVFDTELKTLLGLFEEEKLNHLGEEGK